MRKGGTRSAIDRQMSALRARANGRLQRHDAGESEAAASAPPQTLETHAVRPSLGSRHECASRPGEAVKPPATANG